MAHPRPLAFYAIAAIGVAGIVLKIAGVLPWPWLAVLALWLPAEIAIAVLRGLGRTPAELREDAKLREINRRRIEISRGPGAPAPAPADGGAR